MQNSEHTMTQQMNEALLSQLQMNDMPEELEPQDLIREIEVIKPVVYFNRLIAKLFEDSEFAKEIGDDYNADRVLKGKRNKLIRQAVSDNIPSNTLRINPNKTFDDVVSVLTVDSSNQSIAYKWTREKVFLVAIALNLTFDQMDDLLTHCLGEREINFKDPYETILAYCLLEHKNVYERYISLTKQFEEIEDTIDRDSEEYRNTIYYRNRFSKIDSDEELMDFLRVQPYNTQSTYAQYLFNDWYQQISETIKFEKEESAIQQVREKFDICWHSDLIRFYENEYNRRYEKLIMVKPNEVAEMLLGEDFSRVKGTFKYLKGELFHSGDLKEILAGRKEITKTHLIQLYFLIYCFCSDVHGRDEWDCGGRELFLMCHEDDEDFNYSKLYDDFRNGLNYELNNAGFSDFYLPNPISKLFVYCLFTEHPIESFQKIMEACE